MDVFEQGFVPHIVANDQIFKNCLPIDMGIVSQKTSEERLVTGE